MNGICVHGTYDGKRTRNDDQSSQHTAHAHNDIESGPTSKHFTLFHLRYDKLEKFIFAVTGPGVLHAFFASLIPLSASPLNIFATSDVTMRFPKPWTEFNKNAVGFCCSCYHRRCPRPCRRSRNDKNLMNFLCTF